MINCHISLSQWHSRWTMPTPRNSCSYADDGRPLFEVPSMWTREGRGVYPMAPHITTSGDGSIRWCPMQCAFSWWRQTRSDHHDAVNRIYIRLKKRRHSIPPYRIVVKHIIESSFVWDISTKVTEAKVVELIVHAAENVVELFVQVLFVL